MRIVLYSFISTSKPCSRFALRHCSGADLFLWHVPVQPANERGQACKMRPRILTRSDNLTEQHEREIKTINSIRLSFFAADTPSDHGLLKSVTPPMPREMLFDSASRCRLGLTATRRKGPWEPSLLNREVTAGNTKIFICGETNLAQEGVYFDGKNHDETVWFQLVWFSPPPPPASAPRSCCRSQQATPKRVVRSPVSM